MLFYGNAGFIRLTGSQGLRMKYLSLLLFILFTAFIIICIHPDIVSKPTIASSNIHLIKDTVAAANNQAVVQNTLARTTEAYSYILQHHYNTSFCLLADMHIHSGKNRLFVYSFLQHKIIAAGLVAHGSCNKVFLLQATFSNEPGCGCTAYGKYKIGGKYTGRFGTAYKLYGLDSSNSHAFERNIVLHSYNEMPEKETYPTSIGNSLGCIMVSNGFLKVLSGKIDAGKQPVLLWVFQ